MSKGRGEDLKMPEKRPLGVSVADPRQEEELGACCATYAATPRPHNAAQPRSSTCIVMPYRLSESV